jgi:hypothetical protein
MEMDNNRQYDTLVGLVDSRTGQTIASHRLAQHLRPVNGAPDLLYSTRLDGDGHVITTILKLQIRRP